MVLAQVQAVLDRVNPHRTLRDWFAGQALAGYRASQQFSGTVETRVANQCYVDSDAMLKARDV